MRANRKGKRRCKKVVSIDGWKRDSSDLKLFFIDTVLEDTNIQDTMSTVGVIESICSRLKKEIPALEEVVMVSDNAANYVNLTLPLMAFYVMKAHSLRLLEVLHPDAQQSKNMVDAHFGIGGRQVDRYIREKDIGVITPYDIVEALIYDGGIKATAVDFVRVNRKAKRVLQWFKARDEKKKTKLFDSIGKCGQLQFEEMGNGCVKVTTRKYAGGKKFQYVMEECKIVSGGENGEDIKEGVEEEAGGNEGGVSTNDVVVNRNSDEPCEDVLMNDVEINRIADEIAGGSEFRHRRDSEELNFSQRPPLEITPYTGAAIKFMSEVHYWDRSVFLDCREAFMDAQAEIEADEEDLEDGNDGGAGGRNGRRAGTDVRRSANSDEVTPRRREGPDTVPPDERMEVMNRNGEGSVHNYPNCNRTFRRLTALNEHR